MVYQILAFIIFGLLIMCVGFSEDRGSTSRVWIVGVGTGWIICSLLFPAIPHIINF